VMKRKPDRKTSHTVDAIITGLISGILLGILSMFTGIHADLSTASAIGVVAGFVFGSTRYLSLRRYKSN